MNSRSSQLFGRAVSRVETTEKVVALTFDDGPAPPYTEALLRTLRERGAPATFFVLGQRMEEHPELAAKMVREGHELGSHSYSHRRMIFCSPGFIRDELDRTDALQTASGTAR